MVHSARPSSRQIKMTYRSSSRKIHVEALFKHSLMPPEMVILPRNLRQVFCHTWVSPHQQNLLCTNLKVHNSDTSCLVQSQLTMWTVRVWYNPSAIFLNSLPKVPSHQTISLQMTQRRLSPSRQSTHKLQTESWKLGSTKPYQRPRI
jgi:hypothetical protein